MLNTLSSWVFGGAKPKLLQLDSGRFFRTTSRKPTECLFKDAAIKIEATSEPFQYQLVVQRVFEEDEQETEDDPDPEQIFLIDETMRFYLSSNDESESSFRFQAPGPNNEVILYQFTFDSSVSTLATDFEKSVLQCMFERKNRQSSSQATSEALSSLRGSPGTPTTTPRHVATSPAVPSSSTAASVTPTAKPAPAAQTTPIKNTAAPYSPLPPPNPSLTSTAASASASASKQPPPTQIIIPTGQTVSESSCIAYVFDKAQLKYVLVNENTRVRLTRSDSGAFEYALFIFANDRVIASAKLHPSINPKFFDKQANLTMTFLATGQGIGAWGIKIADVEQARQFVDALGRAMTETTRREAFSNIQDTDRRFYLAQYSDDEDDDVREEEEEEEEEEEDDQPQRRIRDGNDLQVEDDDDDDDAPDQTSGSRGMADFNSLRGTKNSQLAVGMSHADRSFVVRGDKIGVFKITDDDGLEYISTINNIRTQDGHGFSPSKVMLHRQDASLLALNPNDSSTVNSIDLELGKVVEQWSLNDIPVMDILPESKYAQRTAEQTLVGVGSNSIFRIDPRLSKSKVVEDQQKSYQTKMGFKTGATTEASELVVGNEKGELRLFDKLNKQAKTNLPGYGDPIIGVDVSADSRWILATCKTYLLVVPAEHKDNKNITGFTKSLGQNKPIPKRLQLRPEHIALIGEDEISFTPARFNMSQGGEEKAIITSTGPYVISWNFRRVKKGHLDDYRIKKYGANVVADQFKYDTDRSIIVTLPDDVVTTKSDKLASFSSPSRIVKTY